MRQDTFSTSILPQIFHPNMYHDVAALFQQSNTKLQSDTHAYSMYIIHYYYMYASMYIISGNKKQTKPLEPTPSNKMRWER